jgi:alpha-galactosidase
MTSVIFSETSRLWLLHTPATSYALRLDADDTPRHLHWGPPLTLVQAEQLGAERPLLVTSFEGTAIGGAELPTGDGPSFGVPSLQVRFADGTQAVEWRYAEHRIDGGELHIVLRDRHYPLECVLHYRVHDDSDVIERWVTVRHLDADGSLITLLRTDSGCWHVPPRPDYRLTHAVGGWGHEYQVRQTPVPVAETVLTSRRGNTSHHANPWVMLDAGDADEDTGEVWSAALAWSGSWRVTVTRDAVGHVGWTGGFGHDGISWRLRPGEEWDTPVFAGLYTRDGFGATSRKWHDYARRHILPRPSELRPIVYNSWEATGFDVNENNQMRLAATAAALGVEMFVVDDGWFGARSNDHAGLGDWTVNPGRFPNGLGPLIAEVHRLGMRFGIWVEPEMVNPDSDLYREHPDWILHMSNRRRTTLRNQLVLNFARPDVADWAHKWLDRLLTDHEIDFLKWDMNRAFSEAGWPDRGDDAARLWVDHVRNVYAIMDRLRADHPNLRIESCSGGGGRADLGILARTDEVWTSDNTDAVDRIAIQHGYSHLYPTQTMAAWVTDTPNWLTERSVSLRFRFLVAMAGVLGIGGNLSHWTPDELRLATDMVTLYKDIRPVVQHGVQYRLAVPDAALTGVEYVAGDRVVVFVWRRTVPFGHPVVPLRLRGLDPVGTYRDDETGTLHQGAVLLSQGVVPELTEDHSGVVLRLTRMP